MDTDPTGYASDIAVDLSLEFFPHGVRRAWNPLFALVTVRNVSGLFKESLISERTYITFGYEFVLFVFVGKRSLYVFSVEFVLQPPKLWLGRGHANARASADNYALCGCPTAIFMGWDAHCVCPYRLVRSFYDRSRKIIMPTLHPGECFWALRPTTMFSLLS